MTQFCKNCGQPLNPNAKFCPSCGHQMGQSAQSSTQYTNNQNQYSQKQYNAGGYAQQQQPYAYQQPQQGYPYGGQPPYQPPYQQPQKKKGGCCLIALIVLLVILAALGIGGYFAYKYAKDNFNEVKDKIEESLGMPLSSIIDFDDPEQLEKLEELGVTSEDIGKIKEMVDQNDKPKKSKGSNKSSKIKVKDEEFFGVTLPIPDFGKYTEYETESNSFNDEVTTIRIDGISYEQYKEYCKLLEGLSGWEADKDENCAHFPSDYNSVPKVRFTGTYGSLPHISVQYFCDRGSKAKGKPNFCMLVFRTF